MKRGRVKAKGPPVGAPCGGGGHDVRVTRAGVATSIGGIDHLPGTVYCATCGTILCEGGTRVRPSLPPWRRSDDDTARALDRHLTRARAEEIAEAIAALPFEGLELDVVLRIIGPPLAALGSLVSSKADALAVQVAEVAVGSLGGGARIGEAYVTHEIPPNRLQLALQALLGERPEKEPLEARGIRSLAGFVRRAQETLQEREAPSVDRPAPGDAVAADEMARHAIGSPAGRLLWRMVGAGLPVDHLEERWVTTLLMKHTVPRVVAEILCRQGLLGASRTTDKTHIERQRARIKQLLQRST